MKFYETRRKDGSVEWWTQRNQNGIYYLIKRTETRKKFRLFINGALEGATDHDTLIDAQAAANKHNSEQLRKI